MIQEPQQQALDFFGPESSQKDDLNAPGDDPAAGNSDQHDGPTDSVALFDPADLDPLESSATSAGKDLQQRNRRLIEELRAKGPRRPFLLHPDALQRLDVLRTELPHFAGVIDELGDHLALARKAERPLRTLPLLLLGPPGVGKSFFCNKLAQALGLPTHHLAMDNAQGPSLLSGSAAFWSNSQTGLVFKALALGSHISPLILLDEIDKAPRASQYDPLASLHGLLEPSTAQHFQDASFDLPLDARYVVWVATANSVSGLDEPLLSRFSLHTIAPPTPDQARGIASAVVQEVLGQSGLPMEISPELLDRLAQRTPRQQRQSFERALGRAVRHGRDVVLADDLPVANGAQAPRRSIGFVPAR